MGLLLRVIFIGEDAHTDEYEADSPSGHIQGMTLRLFNPKHSSESLWSNIANGTLGYADESVDSRMAVANSMTRSF